MMVLISNDILSEGNVVRSGKENGSCSTNEASVLPLKWKPRKVSAVRVFPPGCGPMVQPVNVVSQEPGAPPSLVSSNNEVNDAGTVGTLVESTEDGSVGLIVETLKDQMETFQNGDNQAVSKEEVSGPVNEVVQVDEVDNGEAKPKTNFPRRRVSAVRDFPPFCGLNSAKPTDEEHIRINGRRSVGTVRDELLQKIQSVESSDKAPMANQDTGATAKDLMQGKMIGIGEESNIDVQDGEVQKFEHDATVVEPKNGLHTKPQNDDDAFTGQTCRELVVYTPDNVLKSRCPDDADGEVSVGTCENESIQNSETQEMVVTPNNISQAPIQKNFRNISDQIMKEAHKKRLKNGSLDATNNTGFVGEVREERKVVLGLMASPVVPLRSVKENVININDGTKTSKGKGNASITHKKSVKRKAGYGEKVVRGESSSSWEKVAYTGTLDMVVRDEEDSVVDTEELPTPQKTHYVEVMPLPFGPKSSNDARNKVREMLRYFQVVCRKLLQGEEAKTREGDESQSLVPVKRVDLAARKILIDKHKVPDPGKKTYGAVPGVEVGDEFQYRVEIALVGIHRTLQAGIDYVRQGKNLVAVSVVASGGYDNELDKPDCLTYSGSGGIGKDKKFEDQKLDKGNLALKNNIQLKIPVRVIRGYKSKPAESSDVKSRVSVTYIYDGLYTVEDYRQEPGPRGNLVFKFELKRIPGQPELALREVKSKKFKTRAGLCADDISGGKEVFRICAINTVDDEKPPSFNYITKIVYPAWYSPVPPKGCDCVGRCSDKRCPCAFKNGGEIPYNHNGAIVEVKPLVYECGPSCRCPPSCYNRVTQHGMKIQLEIFKTESRGWGVRSLSSITSGSFICEYIGELLEDTEAEKRTSNDEYLFDIGQNYNDCSFNPDTKSNSVEVEGTGGFTIDAALYGNVGRFINHSCSPNLYAQNVLYDQEDKRMPHIMLFAAENIPPLQELTYHYNYTVDAVHDSDGNIKVKNCYCGSPECTGRLY